MLTIAITSNRRHWSTLWRRRFCFRVPECWAEVKRPERWYRLAMHNSDIARGLLLNSIIPRRWLRHLSADDLGALLDKLNWLRLQPDCTHVALPEFTHRGTTYYLPRPDAANMSCAEFAVCDDLYGKIQNGDDAALTQMTATLYRPADPDTAAATKRGDKRVTFTHTDESDARVRSMKKVPEVMKAQALMYFGGVKQWVHTVYGPYIFEEPDTDDDGNPIPAAGDDGPNFAWWGVLQAVAEGGVFGTLDEVYQANLHEVCIYLVRKKAEADKMRSMTTTSSQKKNYEQDY